MPSGAPGSLVTNSECIRIADQLRRAFAGDAWHGPPLREILVDITTEHATSRPLPAAHAIWELVLHIDLYVQATVGAVEGTPMPKWYGTEQDWPGMPDQSATAWSASVDSLFRNAERLAQAIEGWSDARLTQIVPGREYDFYYLFHGVVQHSLYHGGQIAMLKKATAVE